MTGSRRNSTPPPPACRASGRELVDDGIVLRMDVRDSEVFHREWRSYLQGVPDDLQVVITQDRIYVEKTR
jgi:hypothetical protein